MADNDSNTIIKPVESLQNIKRLSPTGRREERKRRQNLRQRKKQKAEQEPNDSVDEQNLGNELNQSENGQGTIDYHA